jgi:hypothetical protein
VPTVTTTVGRERPATKMMRLPAVATTLDRERPAATMARPPGTTRAATASRPAAQTIRPSEVIISAGEAAAFRRFVRDVSSGRVNVGLLPELPGATVPLGPSPEITIAPVTLAPLEPVSGEGARP